jgi:hypothetical protein
VSVPVSPAARRVVAGLVAAAAASFGLLASAPLADAHHSESSVISYECAPEGGYLVRWSVTSWSIDDNGNHPAVLAQYSLDGGPLAVVPDDDSALPASDPAGSPIPGLGQFVSGSKTFGGVIHVPHTGADRSLQVVPSTLPTAPQDLYVADGDDAGTELDLIPAGSELFWNVWTKVTEGDLPSAVQVLPAEECSPPASTTSTTSTTVPPTTSTTVPATTSTTVADPSTTSTTVAAVVESTTSTSAPSDVLGLQQNRTPAAPSALARTGSESVRLARFGAVVVAGGLVAVLAADRRRRTLS